MKSRLAVLALALCLVSAAAPAAAMDQSSMRLHLHLTGLRAPEPPHIVEHFLVLSAAGPYRFVGAAFSHEGWRTVHSFERNLYGVFVLALPLPYGEATQVAYRLVIDGAWGADPNNPARARDDRTGSTLSLASLPARPRTVLGVWNPAVAGGAHFYFEGEAGQRVSVAGTFNGWDPFIHELSETSPGRYELSLSLPPGEYSYVFIYRGERVTDPLNRTLRYSSDGRAVSRLLVGN